MAFELGHARPMGPIGTALFLAGIALLELRLPASGSGDATSRCKELDAGGCDRASRRGAPRCHSPIFDQEGDLIPSDPRDMNPCPGQGLAAHDRSSGARGAAPRL